MKTFSAIYEGVIKFDEKPNEDFYSVSKNFPIFAVADGVTQSHYQTGEYAYPRGAKEAAEIFCKSIIEFLEKKQNIKEAFDFANKKIKELNIKYGIDKKMDYMTHDWFDTVGTAGFIAGSKLYFGVVGDCGLAIFDKNNNKKFQTKEDVSQAVRKMKSIYKDWNKLSKNERSLIMHKDFRNNPNKKGYGSFTGEDGVENYYKIGVKNLKEGDMAVFYSDGFFELLEDKNFIRILRGQNREELDGFVMQKAKENEKYGDDRTFVSVIF